MIENWGTWWDKSKKILNRENEIKMNREEEIIWCLRSLIDQYEQYVYDNPRMGMKKNYVRNKTIVSVLRQLLKERKK